MRTQVVIPMEEDPFAHMSHTGVWERREEMKDPEESIVDLGSTAANWQKTLINTNERTGAFQKLHEALYTSVRHGDEIVFYQKILNENCDLQKKFIETIEYFLQPVQTIFNNEKFEDFIRLARINQMVKNNITLDAYQRLQKNIVLQEAMENILDETNKMLIEEEYYFDLSIDVFHDPEIKELEKFRLVIKPKEFNDDYTGLIEMWKRICISADKILTSLSLIDDFHSHEVEKIKTNFIISVDID